MHSKEYDFFISYADADRAWVEGYLLNALQQAGVRCLTEAAFELGALRIKEFGNAIKKSERTLLILSHAYLANNVHQFITFLAQHYGLDQGIWPVIPLIREHNLKLPPSLDILVPLLATDKDEWEIAVKRLCKQLKCPLPAPPPQPKCPYPGMKPFSEDNSSYFFGRNDEIQRLIQRLRSNSFITVIGPSGSGKSSLVFAGLIPTLKGSGLFGPGEWLVRSIRPGEEPSSTLKTSLGSTLTNLKLAVKKILASEPNVQRLLLIVDQFEEIFTLSQEEERDKFQETLLDLAKIPNCYVILTVRADFYPDLMESSLWEQIQSHRLEVLPLNEAGLREAIIKPAENVDVFIEGSLVERLVVDAGKEPGVLPLLQETMVLLWEKIERRFLPFKAYQTLVLASSAYKNLDGSQLTGLQVAIANHADSVFRNLSKEQKQITPPIFLRLIQFGEGRAHTRRQQLIDSLLSVNDDPEIFKETIEHLTKNRLLALSFEYKDPYSTEKEYSSTNVDIAHEALITSWPTLQEWIEKRQEAEQTRRRLMLKVEEWERLGRGDGGLLDEVELAEVRRWLNSSDASEFGYCEALNELVEVSDRVIQEVKEKEETARQRELQLLKERIEQEKIAKEQERRARRRTQLAAVSVIALLFLGVFTWQSIQKSQTDQLIKDAVISVTTPEIVSELAQRSPNYLKVADKAKDAGKVEKALTDYRFLVSLKNIEERIAKNPEEFANLSKQRKIIENIVTQAENSLAQVISQYRLPQLAAELQQGNFGKLKQLPTSTEDSPEFGDFSKYEKQYTGALKTTYAILMREAGAHADRNNDGYLTEGEEKLLPCQTLKEIEELWRKFTENRCGWYGSEDFFEALDCHELEGITLTSKVSILSRVYLMEKRLVEQCQVVSVSQQAT
ncbi:MAG: TIR domain-containing protein [Symploca sp. SIO1B1]|nr:TIR domain-containing protein [Symploca sp. SIO1B1]